MRSPNCAPSSETCNDDARQRRSPPRDPRFDALWRAACRRGTAGRARRRDPRCRATRGRRGAAEPLGAGCPAGAPALVAARRGSDGRCNRGRRRAARHARGTRRAFPDNGIVSGHSGAAAKPARFAAAPSFAPTPAPSATPGSCARDDNPLRAKRRRQAIPARPPKGARVRPRRSPPRHCRKTESAPATAAALPEPFPAASPKLSARRRRPKRLRLPARRWRWRQPPAQRKSLRPHLSQRRQSAAQVAAARRSLVRQRGAATRRRRRGVAFRPREPPRLLLRHSRARPGRREMRRRATVAGCQDRDGRIAGGRRIKDRAPLPIPDWIALIRRLRDEGNTTDAVRELTAFRTAHGDHEKLLPPDLRALGSHRRNSRVGVCESERMSFLIGAGSAAARASSRVSHRSTALHARDGHFRTAIRCG